LQGGWLLLARAAWVSVASLTAGVFISGLPSEFTRLRTPCADAVSCVWVPRLTAQNARELGELGLSVDSFALYWVAIEVSFVVISAAIGVVLFFYLFPDGRFGPRWTRWVALVWITRCK
jgi:hypothetical protein